MDKDTKLAESSTEAKKLLVALGWMYVQYCDGPFGHDFMNAGEDAQEILEDYGLLKDGYADTNKLDELERKLNAKEN